MRQNAASNSTEIGIIITVVVFILFFFSGFFRSCLVANSSGKVYKDVMVVKSMPLYSSGEDGDRFYRVWTQRRGVFDFRDHRALTREAGAIWGQVVVGQRCTFRAKEDWAICGKYKCVVEVIGCKSLKHVEKPGPPPVKSTAR